MSHYANELTFQGFRFLCITPLDPSVKRHISFISSTDKINYDLTVRRHVNGNFDSSKSHLPYDFTKKCTYRILPSARFLSVTVFCRRENCISLTLCVWPVTCVQKIIGVFILFCQQYRSSARTDYIIRTKMVARPIRRINFFNLPTLKILNTTKEELKYRPEWLIGVNGMVKCDRQLEFFFTYINFPKINL